MSHSAARLGKEYQRLGPLPPGAGRVKCGASILQVALPIAIVRGLPFFGGPISRPYMSTVSGGASGRAVSRLTAWRTCSTPRRRSTSIRRQRP